MPASTTDPLTQAVAALVLAVARSRKARQAATEKAPQRPQAKPRPGRRPAA